MTRTNLILAVAAVLFVCGFAKCQMLEIVPEPSVPNGSPADGISTYDAAGWPVGVVRFNLIDDAGNDVTDDAVWTSSKPAKAFFSAPGTLELVSERAFRITISAEHPSLGTVVAPFTFHPGSPEDDGGAANGGAGSSGGGEDLENTIEDIQQMLEDLGLGSLGLDGLEIGYWNDADLEAWYNLNIGGMYEDQNGLFVAPGFVLNGDWWNPTSLLIWNWTENPGIIFSEDVVADLLAGNWFDNNGGPTDALGTLLHEWTHAIIWENGLQDEFESIAEEESFVFELELQIFPRILKIFDILNDGNWGLHDIRNIHLLIKRLKQRIELLKDTYGEVACDVLEALGLGDNNDNGIPDVIDDAILEFLEWLYEWIQNNDWPFKWDPEELFDNFPFYDFPFCDNTMDDEIDNNRILQRSYELNVEDGCIELVDVIAQSSN